MKCSEASIRKWAVHARTAIGHHKEFKQTNEYEKKYKKERWKTVEQDNRIDINALQNNNNNNNSNNNNNNNNKIKTKHDMQY